MTRVVVKCGGAVAGDAAPLILALADADHHVCVVHGAGPQISAEMERLGLPVRFVGGRRVTTAACLAVVRASLEAVNQKLCADLGPRALGLLGDEVGLEAVPITSLGLVGHPVAGCPPAVERTLLDGLIPVVAPIAAGPLNVNADEAAAAIAIGLGADRLLFVTDVPGLIRADGVLPRIRVDEADRLLESGELEGGMLPKLQAAVTAARVGVRAEIGETAVLG